jgi:hypothetical protein
MFSKSFIFFASIADAAALAVGPMPERFSQNLCSAL